MKLIGNIIGFILSVIAGIYFLGVVIIMFFTLMAWILILFALILAAFLWPLAFFLL